ncbi:MAG: hypothetical protein QXM16_07080 [Nitrososphaerota archaeon]
MEYWVPWGSTEVFFEAPPELSVSTPNLTPLTDEEVFAKVSAIPDAPYIFIDYLPPATAYKTLLERLAESCKIAYVSSWRLGLERVGEAVAELEMLEKKPILAPITEFTQETQTPESAILIYPATSRRLLHRIVNNSNEYLTWLFKVYGLNSFDPSRLKLFPLELSYSTEGLIQGVKTQDNRPSQTTPVFDSVTLSPGKAPLDSIFYLTAQAIILSSPVCGEGSMILAVSECRDGLGPPGFVQQLYEALKMGQEGELNLDAQPYRLVAVELAAVLRSYRTYLVTSLPRSLARLLLGLKTFDTIQEGFTQLLRIHGRSHRMLLVREGLHTDLGMLTTG